MEPYEFDANINEFEFGSLDGNGSWSFIENDFESCTECDNVNYEDDNDVFSKLRDSDFSVSTARTGFGKPLLSTL